MSSTIITVYEWFQRHRALRSLSFALLTALMLLLLSGQSYKEDISDFLPLDSKYQKALHVYQSISGADRILALFQCEDSTLTDPDLLTQAVESFLEQLDGRVDDRFRRSIVTGIDVERFAAVTDFAYSHIPYFLTAADYRRLDSLLSDSGYVEAQMEHVKQMLMFPASGLLAENFQKDPLNLFTPTVAKLQPSTAAATYELYDGYVFSPDMKTALVVMTSPHGASETEQNARLLAALQQACHDTETACQGVQVRLTGAPVIAVGNSQQIKSDSVVSVILAVVLIVMLLFAVFRSFRNILLIVLSIGWGWLFAMGLLAVVHNNVSVIVVGISSVILGIAVNYPLHLIAHLMHTPDVKSALKEIVMPLVVGNITTVGAFLALVPLKSAALRDLGLFSSFLLVGTILFVLLFLPHLVSVRHGGEQRNIFSRFADFSLERKPWIVWGVVVLTLVFGYFSLHTSFDANMSHINYMTDAQKQSLATLQHMTGQDASAGSVYVVASGSTLDGALRTSEALQPAMRRLADEGLADSRATGSQFMCSAGEQQQRLQLWNDFAARHSAAVEEAVRLSAADKGFADSTFSDFMHILRRSYTPLPADSFLDFYQQALASHIVVDSTAHKYYMVETLAAPAETLAAIEQRLDSVDDNAFAFDVTGMNTSIATNISDDFNYIGWACGLIVFFFLWLSLGSIELAMLSFLPMALSWIWILGIMAMLHIEFNVVNVILATFIFGQGDDYTIFMTEGCQYEYACRRKMLASYKNSIIVSALIMFIGIGALIVARHPALHSLAEVTIVGMFSVVLMACIFPPLIFRWMVTDGNSYRTRPFALVPLLVTCYCAVVFFTQLATVYILGFLLFVIRRPTKKSKALFHSYVTRCFRFDMKRIATTRFTVLNPHGETFHQPAIVVCNHQSMLDTAYLMALSDKLVIVANEHASRHAIVSQVFKWMDNYALPAGEAIDEERVGRLLSSGYSIVVFPEGERNAGSSILRFHKGAFYLAERFHADIVPLLMHGVNHVFPRNSFCAYPGEVTLAVGERIRHDDNNWGCSYAVRTKKVHQYYVAAFEALRRQKETAAYYKRFVADRYRYKGIEVYGAVKRALRDAQLLDDSVNRLRNDADASCAVVLNSGYGELALLLALCCPDKKVVAIETSHDKRLVAQYSAEGVAANLTYCTACDEAKYNNKHHIIIKKTT